MKAFTIYTILFLAAIQSMFAQVTVNFGVTPFNQDNANPINLFEIGQILRNEGVDSYKELSAESKSHIERRADGTGQAYNLGLGYDLSFTNKRWELQGVPAQAGLSVNVDYFHQFNRSNAYSIDAIAYNAGVFWEAGLRMEVGYMKLAEAGIYADLGAQIWAPKRRTRMADAITGIYIYTRYQRTNPYTKSIKGLFQGNQVTKESLSAGFRIKF